MKHGCACGCLRLATADGHPAGLGQRVIQGSGVHETYFALVDTILEALLVDHCWDEPVIWPVFIWKLSELFKKPLADKLSRFVGRLSMTGSKDGPPLLLMHVPHRLFLISAYSCHSDWDYSRARGARRFQNVLRPILHLIMLWLNGSSGGRTGVIQLLSIYRAVLLGCGDVRGWGLRTIRGCYCKGL